MDKAVEAIGEELACNGQMYLGKLHVSIELADTVLTSTSQAIVVTY